LVFALVALAFMATYAVYAQETPQNLTVYKPPKPLPDLQFNDAAQKPVALSAFRGKVVVLNLWATWCIPCRKEMPTLDDLQAKLGGPGFEVVALSVDRDGLGAVEPFFQKLGITHLATYLDPTGATAESLGAFGLPTTLLIDQHGQEVGLLIGPAEWNSPEMIAFLRGLVANQSSP
jgi:thiol-disulfide isomerase/thioredoxin